MRPLLDPETSGAARVVAGHEVDALAHQLDDEQAAMRACAASRRGRRRVSSAGSSASGSASRRRARWCACRACAPSSSTGSSPAPRRHRPRGACCVRTPSSSNGALALPLRQMRILVEVEMRRHHRLAEAVEQKARLAVQRTAAGRLHAGADQPGRQRRLEQHRHFAGLRPCASAGATARARPHSAPLPRARPARLRRASSCTRRRAACRRRAPQSAPPRSSAASSHSRRESRGCCRPRSATAAPTRRHPRSW